MERRWKMKRKLELCGVHRDYGVLEPESSPISVRALFEIHTLISYFYKNLEP